MAEAISRETGKALWETSTELQASMAGKVDISIRAYDERTGERTAETAFGHATLRHRPHGLAAVLGPFNFPGHLPNGHIVPALLAGDTVVFKPSEETPLTGQLMAECLWAADLPTGVVNLVQGGRDTGAALLDSGIDALMFTGSGAAGAYFRKQVRRRSARHPRARAGRQQSAGRLGRRGRRGHRRDRGPVRLRHHRPALLLRPPPDRARGPPGRRHPRGRGGARTV
jgi:acyl-CoA reductase-like NAD-dependent aldehyde dehydrogenase